MGPAWIFFIVLNLSVIGQVRSPSLEACNIARDWIWQGWYRQRPNEIEPEKYNISLTPCRWNE